VGGAAAVDVAVGAILAVALLRGVLLGLVREAFSIAAVGAACIAVRLYGSSASEWLVARTSGQVGTVLAPWIAGLGVGVAAIAIVVLLGRLLRRGARWAGLGWIDRLGGAVLGTAEGLIVAGILLLLAAQILGRGHPALATSRSLAAFERLEQIARAGAGGSSDVAAPPPRL
jgi:membrane protein required for colicin V production